MFTQTYSQPQAYRFCQDSVLTPKLIAEDLLRTAASPRTALDVCAGCGVMGLELLHALGPVNSIERFDFLEIQDEFREHFETNRAVTKNERLNTNWIPANYAELLKPEHASIYDLVIANPPYFAANEGSASPNELNTRARFFIDSDLKTLLAGIRNALKPGGLAYILMKSGKEHGRDAFTSARVQLFDCEVERLADVRGTDLLKIKKGLA